MKSDLNIGEFAYPMDNSYAKCLSKSDTYSSLAGNINVAPCLVEIMSEPFDVPIYDIFSGKLKTMSFVIVKYEELHYMILNQFHDNERAAFSRFHNLPYLLDYFF